MKKLMIATAVVLAAVFAHAGTVKWTMTNVYTGDTENLASGNLYMFTTADYTTSTIVSAIQDAYVNGYDTAAKGTAGLNAFLNDKALGSSGTAYTLVPGTAGTYSIGSTGLPAAVDNSDLGLTGGTSYTFFAVVFDDTVANFDDDTKFYVSNTKTGSTKSDSSTQSLSLLFSSQATNSQNSNNWYSVVPEPTSGLLMLLGMAGLALRRRRA